MLFTSGESVVIKKMILAYYIIAEYLSKISYILVLRPQNGQIVISALIFLFHSYVKRRVRAYRHINTELITCGFARNSIYIITLLDHLVFFFFFIF